MRKTVLLALLIFSLFQFVFAQNTIAKFKYEEAEQAFVNEDYKTTLTKLEEVEKILGEINPTILYLRIMAQNQVLGENPYDTPEQLLSLKKNCKFYLTKYENLNDIEDKYKDVYKISDYLTIYSDNPDFFTARAALEGLGVPEDFVKGKSFCEKAIAAGETAAMNLMGYSYYYGKGVEKDVAKAMEWYQKSSDMGNVMAMVTIGNEYSKGVNLTKDEVKAVSMYKKSADKGFPEAMCRLANCYYYGEGAEKDYLKAAEWCLKAAAKGNAEAICMAGHMYDTGEGVIKNKIKAMNYFQKAAKLGNYYALYRIGVIYYNGKEGAAPNYTEAMNWFIKAADKNNMDAVKIIASMYKEGKGVAKDNTEAINWYKKAAEKDDDEAMYEVGNLYYLGTGLSQSAGLPAGSEAMMGFLAASNFGNDGTQNYTEALFWYRKAAEKNHVLAMKKIAIMYENGMGVKRNKKIAQEWNNKAALAETKK